MRLCIYAHKKCKREREREIIPNLNTEYYFSCIFNHALNHMQLPYWRWERPRCFTPFSPLRNFLDHFIFLRLFFLFAQVLINFIIILSENRGSIECVCACMQKIICVHRTLVGSRAQIMVMWSRTNSNINSHTHTYTHSHKKKNPPTKIFESIRRLLILYEFIPSNGNANIGLED